MKSHKNWRRDLVVGLIPLFFGIELLATLLYLPSGLGMNHALRAQYPGVDFRTYYAGAVMLREGERGNLYDLDRQRAIEDQTVFPSTLLPIIHPAYEYLFFLPLTFLPYLMAYSTYLCINLGLAIWCALAIKRLFSLDGWLVFGLFVAFLPIWETLQQGQDSIWMLALLIVAYELEINRHELSAGAVLGLTAFRFHLLIPILVLYCLWKRWDVVKGALLTAIPLAIISVGLVGVYGTLAYIRQTAQIATTSTAPDANLRGLAVWLGHGSIYAVLLLAASLIALLGYMRTLRPSLATAVLILPFATYHFGVHDLSVLLLPMAAMMTTGAVVQFVVVLIGTVIPFSFLAGMPAAWMLIEQRRLTRLYRSALNPLPQTYRRGRCSPSLAPLAD